jgi:carbon storage regulator CsrA
MLLVARRVGEALRIGTNIEVKVVAATRSRVMLAVTAPRELNIRRIYGKSDYKNVDLNESADSMEAMDAGQETADAEEEDTGESEATLKLRNKQIAGE